MRIAGERRVERVFRLAEAADGERGGRAVIERARIARREIRCAGVAAIGVFRRAKLGVGFADTLKGLGVRRDVRLQRREGAGGDIRAAVEDIGLGLDQARETWAGSAARALSAAPRIPERSPRS
ncbi:MAG: hypothetical protein QM698_06760 [Micropepsaceae bacterium]